MHPPTKIIFQNTRLIRSLLRILRQTGRGFQRFVAAGGCETHGRRGDRRQGEAVLEDTLENFKELDRVLKNHYRNNPQKYAEWLTASHVERRRRNDSGSPGENPPTP
jgi:hypothetical protein